jgi:hypothetical protein
MKEDRVDELFWKMFEQSGNTGYYMMYNALKQDDTTKNIKE